MANEATKKDLADLEKRLDNDINDVARDLRELTLIVTVDRKCLQDICTTSNRHEVENREADKRYYGHDKDIVALKQQMYALQTELAALKKRG